MTHKKSKLQQRIENDLRIDDSVDAEENRRTRILSAAIQECSEVGYKNANMTSVAKRAGVSTASLYRAFKDKTDLFLNGVIHVSQLLSEEIRSPIWHDDKFVEVKKMLIHHGSTLGDPYLIWLFRLFMNSADVANARALALIAKMGRVATEQRWQAHLEKLESQGYLRHAPYSITTNLLLGQVDRQTMLSNIIIEHGEGFEKRLEDAANFATIGLFANLGTEAFFQDHPQYR